MPALPMSDLKTIDDAIRHPKINHRDKSRLMHCYKTVMNKGNNFKFGNINFIVGQLSHIYKVNSNKT